MKTKASKNIKTNFANLDTVIKWYSPKLNYKRFNHCNAYISEVVFCSAENVTFQLIKSYDTIVGFVNLDTKEYIELGKWSRTTSKQVTQIYNTMFKSFDRKFIRFY